MRHGRSLDAPTNPELGQDPRHMDTRRLVAHEQLRTDLAIGAPLGQQEQNLMLTRGKTEPIDR